MKKQIGFRQRRSAENNTSSLCMNRHCFAVVHHPDI